MYLQHDILLALGTLSFFAEAYPAKSYPVDIAEALGQRSVL